ncbi:MAG: hypothetical protein CMLOHMNK_01426 [Steroidobacteraceae bacterium]|nr:hypothetical protein [Steroidobacteraceae bacterium]
MSEGIEEPLLFPCEGSTLVGILHRAAAGPFEVAVLVVVGGPQYRVGSHRQFVSSARSMAAAGYPVLRFDYRGMGDSEGEFKGFEHISSDIRSAIDALYRTCHPRRGIVLFGLCDAASAALAYCGSDARVVGLVLINPWVRSARSEAEVVVKRYYTSRLRQVDFWRKLVGGDFDFFRSLGALIGNLKRAVQRPNHTEPSGYIDSMRAGLAQFTGPVMVVQSGRDLTADEFRALCRRDRAWKDALSRPSVEIVDMADADHTFSGGPHLEQLNQRCGRWLAKQFGSGSCP